MVVSIIFITVYIALLVILITGWYIPTKTPRSEEEHLISVIVPVRNERQNILKLFTSLRSQTYTRFEVIIIDDHSEDGSAGMILALDLPDVKVVRNEGIGKKSAIATGVKLAAGDIIVTTDADCQFSPRWIEVINSFFCNGIQMVIGGVRFSDAHNFFQKLQQLEFASLIGSSASLANINQPVMCNGANLSYRRSAFFDVNGYQGNDHIASGDDEFLMRKFVRLYNATAVRFMTDQDGTATTTSNSSANAFVNQRRRWASKWKVNSSWTGKVLAVLVFAFQICWLASLFVLFLNFNWVLLLFVLAKMAGEAVLLKVYCRFLKISLHPGVFLSLQLIYPLYVVYIGITANFFNYSWKGREYSHSL
jgi:poly-beta-1,6-N-acetyl-D-glucosamine synthase